MNLETINRRDIQTIACIVGVSLLIFTLLNFVLPVLSYFFCIPINRYFFYTSCFLVIFMVFYLKKINFVDINIFYISLISIIFIISFSIIVAIFFYDISYDGQAYHQEAIIQLSKGWNPIYETIIGVPHSIWINHYPKASWIYGASTTLATGSIESSKSFNIILCFTALTFSITALLNFKNIRTILCFLIALLAAFNPVSLGQMWGSYIDGALASLITIIYALSVCLFKKQKIIYLVALIIASILLINIKFTGLIYILIYFIGYIILLIFYKKYYYAKNLFKLFILIALTGIVIFGYNPYIKNYLINGNSFYPLYGVNSVDIMSANTPKSLVGMGKLEKLTVSIFHVTSNDSVEAGLNMKVPLSISSFKELKASTGPDPRFGGWGILFSGIFLLSLLLLVMIIKKIWFTKELNTFLFCIGILLFSIIVNPQSWWARYVPQLWLIPLTIFFYAHSVNATIIRYLAFAGLILMFINSGIIFSGALAHNYIALRMISRELSFLKLNTHKINIYFGDFESNRLRLEKAGIGFTRVSDIKELNCAEEKIIVMYSSARYCN